MEPDRDALADAGDDRVRAHGSRDEEPCSDSDVQEPRGRRVQHREEDPEEEQRAAEVVGLDEHEHRAAPDDEEGAEVLESALRQHLTLLAQVAGEEDDQRELRQLAGLELERPELHPQAGAVDGGTDDWEGGQDEQTHGGEPEQVLVVLEPPIIAEEEQREGEEGHPEHHPDSLAVGVRRLEPVDLGHADRGQEARDRQQIGIRERDRQPGDDVGDEVEPEEDGRVRQRGRRDHRLARDVDAGEADRRQRAHRNQAHQLTVSLGHGTTSSSYLRTSARAEP